MKKIKFNQDLNLWYELADTLGDTLWDELKIEIRIDLYWNLERLIRRIS